MNGHRSAAAVQSSSKPRSESRDSRRGILGIDRVPNPDKGCGRKQLNCRPIAGAAKKATMAFPKCRFSLVLQKQQTHPIDAAIRWRLSARSSKRVEFQHRRRLAKPERFVVCVTRRQRMAQDVTAHYGFPAAHLSADKIGGI